MYSHMDMFIEAKSKEEININDYSSKTCKNYLLLCNLLVPLTIKQKREAVLKNKQSISNDNEDFQ